MRETEYVCVCVCVSVYLITLHLTFFTITHSLAILLRFSSADIFLSGDISRRRRRRSRGDTLPTQARLGKKCRVSAAAAEPMRQISLTDCPQRLLLLLLLPLFSNVNAFSCPPFISTTTTTTTTTIADSSNLICRTLHFADDLDLFISCCCCCCWSEFFL